MDYKITLEEYKNFKQVLNATSEDRQLGIENLKNIECDNIYKILIFKSVNLSNRKEIIKDLKFLFEAEPYSQLLETIKRTWGNAEEKINLDWQSLDNFIKEHCLHLDGIKEVFESIMKYELNDEIKTILDIEFIDDVKIKIKW